MLERTSLCAGSARNLPKGSKQNKPKAFYLDLTLNLALAPNLGNDGVVV